MSTSFLQGILGDLDAPLNDWGEEQEFTPPGGEPVTFTGVFEDEYNELSLAGMTVAGGKPAVWGKSSDLSTAVRDSAISITAVLYGLSGAPYKIEKNVPNPPDLGPGYTRLVLRK